MTNLGRPESVTVRMDGATVAADRWPGNGPTVVLLHAGVADRRSWREVASRLAPGMTVVAYDCRGFGGSPPAAGPFSHLGDLAAVLDKTADGPVWLVGSSMGGRLALDLAVTEPHRILGLVLLAPGVSGAPADEPDPDTQRLSTLMDQAEAEGDVDRLGRLLTHLWLDGPGQPEGRISGPARTLALDMVSVILRNNPPEEAEDRGLDTWHRLGEVTVPATVACGDLDLPHIVSTSRQLARLLPRGRHRVLTGTAHLPYLEDPGLVADVIAEAVTGS